MGRASGVVGAAVLVASVAAAGASLMLASVMLALPLGFDTQGVG